jgi:hypothetical protein
MAEKRVTDLLVRVLADRSLKVLFLSPIASL